VEEVRCVPKSSAGRRPPQRRRSDFIRGLGAGSTPHEDRRRRTPRRRRLTLGCRQTSLPTALSRVGGSTAAAAVGADVPLVKHRHAVAAMSPTPGGRSGTRGSGLPLHPPTSPQYQHPHDAGLVWVPRTQCRARADGQQSSHRAPPPADGVRINRSAATGNAPSGGQRAVRCGDLRQQGSRRLPFAAANGVGAVGDTVACGMSAYALLPSLMPRPRPRRERMRENGSDEWRGKHEEKNGGDACTADSPSASG